MNKVSPKIFIFIDRYPIIGPLFWLLSLQYYVTQFIVATAWSRPYSILNNTISDLGNTVCGNYRGNIVCSPLNAWMNFSFILLGIFMISGSGLIYREFKQSLSSAVGFIFMAVAGVGAILVGLFPENTIAVLHITGAGLSFFLGNLALIILGLTLKLPRFLRIYTVFSGILAMLALALFLTHNYLGLGIGGMERLVAYPQSIWLIIMGVYMSTNHYQKYAKPKPHY